MISRFPTKKTSQEMQDRMSSPTISTGGKRNPREAGVSTAPALVAGICSASGAPSVACDTSFHLKLMGTARNRSFSLAVRRHSPAEQLESPVVKTLKVVLDQGVCIYTNNVPVYHCISYLFI